MDFEIEKGASGHRLSGEDVAQIMPINVSHFGN